MWIGYSEHPQDPLLDGCALVEGWADLRDEPEQPLYRLLQMLWEGHSLIFIDRRTGSKEFLKPLQDVGIPASITELNAGDIAFIGRGPNDTEITIGLEFKTLGDLISSIRSGRLADPQLPGLRSMYEYSWLVVEGQWRHDDQGQIVTYKGQQGWAPIRGGMKAAELEKHVLTFELCGGLHTRFTNTRKDTIRFFCTLYRWWTDIAQDKHTSHLALQNLPSIVQLSDFRQAICKWPGVGLRTSKAIEDRFRGLDGYGSITDAVMASSDQWAEIQILDDQGKSRRFGEKAARKVKEFLK